MHGTRNQRSAEEPPSRKALSGSLGPMDEVQTAQYLEAIVQSSEDAIIGSTPDGTIISWNEGAGELYGYAADDVLGRPVSVLGKDEYSGDLRRIFDEIGRGERISRFEMIHAGRNGREFPVSLSATPIFGSHDEMVGAVLVVRSIGKGDRSAALDRWLPDDIEQHVAERTAELRRSNEALWQEIARRAASEETMRFIAEATIELAGSLDYDTTLGNVARLVVPRLADWCAIDLLEDDGSVRQVTVVHSDPSKVDLVKQLRQRHPVDMNSRGGIADVIRTGKSMLYREITPDDLQVADRDPEYLRIVRTLELRSALIVPLKARGRTFGAITLVMAESGRLYNEQDESRAQKLANSCALAVDNARLYRRAKYEIGERRRAQAELNELNQTLERRVAERTRELEETNERLHSEIVERQRAESALERSNAALLRSNRELQDFAHVASHDLQEPLRKITSFAEILLEEHSDVLDEEGRTFLERVDDAAKRMTALVHDLLMFSRLRTQEQQFERIDLNRVVNDVLSDLATRIEDVNGTVEVSDLPSIEADETQMRQLLQNLIGNALKFHREDVPPVVWVEASLEEDSITGIPPGNGPVCRLTVTDNGVGFDMAHAEQMFSPFQRLHGRRFSGTGMGLAICRRIAERHGGHITATGEPDRGSRFIVELPVSHPSGDPLRA